MPVPARAKGGRACSPRSMALEADATQTSLCADPSVIALVGVALNTASAGGGATGGGARDGADHREGGRPGHPREFAL